MNPEENTFHAPGTQGSSCVDCHMPKRDYMGRDPRSDHRFPIPDPLLTKELGTPNACNDCHADKGLDWQIEWTNNWYGEKMNRPERDRTRAIHAAQNGITGALALLLKSYDIEEIDAWKATLLRLMEPWSSDSRVVKRTNVAAHEGDPLTRVAAAMLIGRRGDQGAPLDKVLSDPLRAVRLEAAWAAFERLPQDHPVINEAVKVAQHQSDQPGGAMRMARVNMKLGNIEEAEKWFKRAAAWDQTSPAPRRDLAVFLSSQGRTKESVDWLDKAAQLAPDNAEIPYLAALACAEVGDIPGAESRLRTAVSIAPGFSRAYYNLGLIQNGQGKPQEAVTSLGLAAQTDPLNADAPYAQATILIRLGQVEQAITAAQEALRRDPNHQGAQQFLRQLGR
ncbi:MAG: ammonia-forming cytochrome c nitrite reductase subunit c552 [Verrucomicrobiales bacterium]